MIIVDYVATWTGTREAPLGYVQVCSEIAAILKRWTECRVRRPALRSNHPTEISGIGYPLQGVHFWCGNAARYFWKYQAPDISEVDFFCSTSQNCCGNFYLWKSTGPLAETLMSVRVAVALVAFQLSKVDVPPMPPIFINEHRTLWMNPYDCPWWVDCANCPKCHDEGECLGYLGSAMTPVLAGCKSQEISDGYH